MGLLIGCSNGDGPPHWLQQQRWASLLATAKEMSLLIGYRNRKGPHWLQQKKCEPSHWLQQQRWAFSLATTVAVTWASSLATAKKICFTIGYRIIDALPHWPPWCWVESPWSFCSWLPAVWWAHLRALSYCHSLHHHHHCSAVTYRTERAYLKEQPNEIFDLQIFSSFESTVPVPGPLTKTLKDLRFWLRFCWFSRIFEKKNWLPGVSDTGQ